MKIENPKVPVVDEEINQFQVFEGNLPVQLYIVQVDSIIEGCFQSVLEYSEYYNMWYSIRYQFVASRDSEWYY